MSQTTADRVSNTMASLALASLLLACFIFSNVVASDDAAPRVTSLSPSRGSVNGGTRVTILGSGFDLRGRSNDVYIGTEEIGFFCDPDPKECNEERIVCVTERTENRGDVPVVVTVDGRATECASPSACTFEITDDRTPLVSSIFPQVIQGYAKITVSGDKFQNNGGDQTINRQDFDVRLGSERCSLGDRSVAYHSFVCDVDASVGGGSLQASVALGDTGRAEFDDDWTRSIVTVVPVVSSVSPAHGSTLGGTEVTITGTGFDPTNTAVSLGAQGCILTDVTPESIRCVTTPGASTADACSNQAAWVDGVEVRWWRNLITKTSLEKFQWTQDFLEPSGTVVVDNFGTIPVPTQNYLLWTQTAYFVPNVTGEHTFWIAADDGAELWLSDDTTPVGREWATSDAVDPLLHRIIATGYTGGSFDVHAGQKSEPQHLIAGEKYWLRIIARQHGGGMLSYLRVELPTGERLVNFGDGFAKQRVPCKATEVTVISGCIAAKSRCENGECSFTYVAPQWNVTAVEPATVSTGETITLIGSFMGSFDVLVTVGDELCVVTSGNTSMIFCTAPAMPAGRHVVKVVSRADGAISNDFSVRYRLAITSVTQDGGLISIHGKGFAKSEALIRLSGIPCHPQSILPNLIVCSVGNVTSNRSLTTNVSLQVRHHATYTNGFMPLQSFEPPQTQPVHFYPKIGSINGGFILTVKLAGMCILNKADVTIQLGSNPCMVVGVYASVVRCLATVASVPGPVAVTVTVAGQSPVRAPVDLVLRNRVDDVWPDDISRYGGTKLRMRVETVGGTSVERLGVRFGPKRCSELWEDGYSVQCILDGDAEDDMNTDLLHNATLTPLVNFSDTPDDANCTADEGECPTVEVGGWRELLLGSTGCKKTGGKFVIPAGGSLHSRQKFDRPIEIRAVVQPSSSYVSNGASCIRMQMSPDGTSTIIGYQGVAGLNGGYAVRARTHIARYIKEADGNLADIFLNPQQSQVWSLRVWPRHIEFRVNGVLIDTYVHNGYSTGVIGFRVCQEVTVSEFAVYDIRQQAFTVTAESGDALDTSDTLRFVEPPAKITSMDTTVVAGERVNIYGSLIYNGWQRNYQEIVLRRQKNVGEPCPRNRWAYSQFDWRLCPASNSVSHARNQLWCNTFSNTPAGQYWARFRAYEGWLNASTSIFNITVVPNIKQVKPNTLGTNGGAITISGAGFSNQPADISLAGCSVLECSATQIIADCAAQPSGSVFVPALVVSGITAQRCESCNTSITDSVTPPTITTASPAVLTSRGQNLRISGTGLTSGIWNIRVWVGRFICEVVGGSGSFVDCRLRGYEVPLGVYPIRVATTVGGWATGNVTVEITNATYDDTGACAAGGLCRLLGNAFHYGSFSTQVFTQNFTAGDGISGAWKIRTPNRRGQQPVTECGSTGRVLGGYRWFDADAEVNFSLESLPPHTHLRVQFGLLLVDSWDSSMDFDISVDGNTATWGRYDTVPYGSTEFGSLCGNTHRHYHETITDTSVVVPHSADNVTIEFASTASSGRTWGLRWVMVSVDNSTAKVFLNNRSCEVIRGRADEVTFQLPADAAAGTQTIAFSPSGRFEDAWPCASSACTTTVDATPLRVLSVNPVSGTPDSDWVDEYGIEFLDGGIVKKTRATNTWDAGCNSMRTFTLGSGFRGISFRISNPRAMVGLAFKDFVTRSYTNLDFAWYLDGGNRARVYEAGNGRFTGPVVDHNATFGIELDTTSVVYTIDGVAYFRSRRTVQWPLRIQLSLHDASVFVWDLKVIEDGSGAGGANALVPVTMDLSAEVTARADQFFAYFNGRRVPIRMPNNGRWRITCFIRASEAALGASNSIQIRRGSVELVKPSSISVSPPRPRVTSLSTASGSVDGGQKITLEGANFFSTPTVTIGSVACTVESFTRRRIVCVTGASPNASTGLKPTVTCGGVASECDAYCPTYSFSEQIVISSVVIDGSDVLVVSGTNIPADATVVVSNNGETLTAIEPRSTTELRCQLTDAVSIGVHSFRIRSAAVGQSQSSSFNRTLNGTISFAPTSIGAGGDAVIVFSGGMFGRNAAAVTIRVGGIPLCDKIEPAGQTCKCTTVAGTFNGAIEITVGTESATLSTIDASSSHAPTVTSVVPASCAPGETLTIAGTFLQNAVSVTVGDADCEVISSAADAVLCILRGAVDHRLNDVKCTTSARGRSSIAARLVRGNTVISRISPTSAASGETVTIRGSGFGRIVAGVSLRIGGRVAVVRSCSLGEIVATVPSVPLGESIRVSRTIDLDIADSEEKESATFDIDVLAAETPRITDLWPRQGSAFGGATLTMLGLNFGSRQSTQVTVGGTPCKVEFVHVNKSMLTCVTNKMMPTPTATIGVTANGLSWETDELFFAAEFNVTSIIVGDGAESTDVVALSTVANVHLTLIGRGFPTSPRGEVAVGNQSCKIESSNWTHVVCHLGVAKRTAKAVGFFTMVPTWPTGVKDLSFTVNGAAAVCSLQVNFTTESTPNVETVSADVPNWTPAVPIFDGSNLVINGFNFGTEGSVEITLQSLANQQQKSTCNVVARTSTSVTCKIDAATNMGRQIVKVRLPSRGDAFTNYSCPAGEFLQCDGSCLSDKDCRKRSWGVNNCDNLFHILYNDSFCHSNGGTDKVNKPMRTDRGREIHVNCPMYNCEGTDCDTVINIAGQAARVSTCQPDHNAFIVDVRPQITSIVAASRQSGLNGGLQITMIGTSLWMSSTIRIGKHGICDTISAAADGKQLVCETRKINRGFTGGTLVLKTGSIAAVCNETTVCGGFNFSIASTPEVTSVVGLSQNNDFVLTAGETLTIFGSGFGDTCSQMKLVVDGNTASASQCNATMAVFVLPSCSRGRHEVTLRIVGMGRAVWFTRVYGIVQAVIESISHSEGSALGGQLLTIYGSGFSSIPNEVDIAVGSCGTNVISTNATVIVVETKDCPPSTGTVEIICKIGGVRGRNNCGCTYRVSQEDTPQCTTTINVTHVTYTVVESWWSRVVGKRMRVFVGEVEVDFVMESNYNLVFAWPAYMPGGAYQLRFWVEDFGYGVVQVDDPRVYPLTVSSVTPTNIALGGLKLVTVTGFGFGSITRVKVNGKKCNVRSFDNDTLTCITPPNPEGVYDLVVENIPGKFMLSSPVPKATLQLALNYTEPLTPYIYALGPLRGSTAGGTPVTLTGIRLSTSHDIFIDGSRCTQSLNEKQESETHANAGEVLFCTTGPHATTLDNATIRIVTQYGDGISTAEYMYIDLWSRWTTWGNQAPPVEGDSVVVKSGQTVMVDYSPPRLHLIIVMGHLIFDDKDLTLECTYIMVNFGRLTIGKPERPFEHKALIRLYGDRLTPEIPVHGAKVLAVRNGALDIHGSVRSHTWTKLAENAEKTASSIIVRDSVDWKVGEDIVIASTDYYMEHAEERTVVGIVAAAGGRTKLIIDRPLEFYHHGVSECFGTGAQQKCIDEIAEVMLLSRNVVIEGDSTSRTTGFGATTYLMPNGNSWDRYARMSYVELRHVGQKYLGGRNPIYFRNRGSSRSYIKGCSIHHSMNRAVAISGASHGQFIANGVYETYGHAFYMEDGTERYNTLRGNLVITTRTSTSLLNTDVTPASYWITHPQNTIVDNHAAGSGGYGFWISPFHPHSVGATGSRNICPSTSKLVEFTGNVAHSSKRHGLNVFQHWWPKASQCNRNSNDAPQTIENMFTYKNKIHGVAVGHSEVGQIGAVVFDGLKSADNGHWHNDAAGFWVETISTQHNLTCGVQNSVFVATSGNTPYTARRRDRRGVNLPEGDNFFVKNATFINYVGRNYAIEPQSWARPHTLEWSWGWEAYVEGLAWINSIQRARFRFPHHGVINDVDGSFAGEANTQIAPFAPMYDPILCPNITDSNIGTLYPSVRCNASHKIRRLTGGMNQIWLPQVWTVEGRQEVVRVIHRSYCVIGPVNRLISIDFQHGFNPSYWSWRAHRRFSLSSERFMFTTYYIDKPLVVNMSVPGVGNLPWNITTPEIDAETSAYGYNSTSGNFTGLLTHDYLEVRSKPCPNSGCPAPPAPPAVVDKDCTSFDLTSSWNAGAVPADDADIDLAYNESICLDRASGIYRFESLRVAGKLVFKNSHCPASGVVVVRVARWIHIRGGTFQIGEIETPLTGCVIRIEIGTVDYNNVPYHRVLPWSTRTFAVEYGSVDFFGAIPQPIMARLRVTALAGATTLLMDRDCSSWKAGMRLAVAGVGRHRMYEHPDSRDDATENVVIASVSGSTVTLVSALQFTHLGADSPYHFNNKSIFVGTEVICLSRNIEINGGSGDNWFGAVEYGIGWNLNVGCSRALTRGCSSGNGNAYAMGTHRTGTFRMQGVCLRDIGQRGAHQAAIDIDGLVTNSSSGDAYGSFLRGCSIVRTFNRAIVVRRTTTNFTIDRTVVFNFEGDAVNIHTSGNDLTDNIVLGQVTPSDCVNRGGCRLTGYAISRNNRMVGNLVIGTAGAGYVVAGESCINGKFPEWSNNVAHSVRDGVLLRGGKPAYKENCVAIRGITAYWAADQGVVAWYTEGHIVVENVMTIDTTIGLAAILYQDRERDYGHHKQTLTVRHSTFVGSFETTSCNVNLTYACRNSKVNSRYWCNTYYQRSSVRFGTIGILQAAYVFRARAGVTDGEPRYAWIEPDSYPTMQGQTKVHDVHFDNFIGTNASCGTTSVAFAQNIHVNDTFHQHRFERVSWGSGSTPAGAFRALRTYGDIPNHITDEFHQTTWLDFDNNMYGAYWADAPNKVWIVDVDGTFTRRDSLSSIVTSESAVRGGTFANYGWDGKWGNNLNALPPVRPECNFSAPMQSYVCNESVKFMTLTMESLAPDRMRRRYGPIVLCKGDGMMDSTGKPLCQEGAVDFAVGPPPKGRLHRATLEREPRWRFTVENGGNYTLFFRGGHPSWTRFRLVDHEYLKTNWRNLGVTINWRMFGPNANVRVGMFVNGVRQRAKVGSGAPWDQLPALTWPNGVTDKEGAHYHNRGYLPLAPGENPANRQQVNVMSFVVKPHRLFDTKMEAIVQISLRVAVPLQTFFNQRNTFAIALAKVLGISESRIRFVTIVPGGTKSFASRRQLLDDTNGTEIGIEIDPIPTNITDGVEADEEIANPATEAPAIIVDDNSTEAPATPAPTTSSPASTPAPTTPAAVDDLDDVVGAVAQLNGNPSLLSAALEEEGGESLEVIVTEVLKSEVVIEVPAVVIQDGFDYVEINATAPGPAQFDIDAVAASVLAFVKASNANPAFENLTVADLAIGNEFAVNENLTRFTVNFIIADDVNAALSNAATQVVASATSVGTVGFLPAGYSIASFSAVQNGVIVVTSPPTPAPITPPPATPIPPVATPSPAQPTTPAPHAPTTIESTPKPETSAATTPAQTTTPAAVTPTTPATTQAAATVAPAPPAPVTPAPTSGDAATPTPSTAPSTPQPTAASKTSGRVTLNIPATNVNTALQDPTRRAALWISARTAVSKLLRADAALIVIDDVRSGSMIIDFHTTDMTVATSMESNIADAINSPPSGAFDALASDLNIAAAAILVTEAGIVVGGTVAPSPTLSASGRGSLEVQQEGGGLTQEGTIAIGTIGAAIGIAIIAGISIMVFRYTRKQKAEKRAKIIAGDDDGMGLAKPRRQSYAAGAAPPEDDDALVSVGPGSLETSAHHAAVDVRRGSLSGSLRQRRSSNVTGSDSQDPVQDMNPNRRRSTVAGPPARNFHTPDPGAMMDLEVSGGISVLGQNPVTPASPHSPGSAGKPPRAPAAQAANEWSDVDEPEESDTSAPMDVEVDVDDDVSLVSADDGELPRTVSPNPLTSPTASPGQLSLQFEQHK